MMRRRWTCCWSSRLKAQPPQAGAGPRDAQDDHALGGAVGMAGWIDRPRPATGRHHAHQTSPVRRRGRGDGSERPARHRPASAYRVDDIYAICDRLMKAGVTINRPPRDGHMAFIRSPDSISIELLQKGGPK